MAQPRTVASAKEPSVRLSVRVSTEKHQELQKQAKRAGLTLSAYVRHVVQHG